MPGTLVSSLLGAAGRFSWWRLRLCEVASSSAGTASSRYQDIGAGDGGCAAGLRNRQRDGAVLLFDPCRVRVEQKPNILRFECSVQFRGNFRVLAGADLAVALDDGYAAV